MCDYLPDECWELILNRLHHHSHFEPLSLVCKRFLSLTNRLRLRFSAVDPTYLVHGTISKLIPRFPCLKTLDLSQLRLLDLDALLLEIAAPCSALSLEALDISNHNKFPVIESLKLSLVKNLKVFKCANLSTLRDADLIAVANTLPFLEELDISYPRNDVDSFSEFRALSSSEFSVTDYGIIMSSSGLKNLLKINLSGNHFLTDKSVTALSMNCLRLSEIAILECSLITLNGIRFMLSNCPHLRLISMDGIESPSLPPVFIEPVTFGRALSTLVFQYSNISDEFLYSIAKACIPLKRISLFRCTGYTISGISFLLYTYQSFEILDLTGNDFLDDQSIIDLSRYLHSLVAIKLNSCFKLTISTLFTLAKNCPLLEDIGMRKITVTKENSLLEFVKNLKIKSLDLAWCLHLTDDCLGQISLVCPNLELLDIRSCSGITDEGITETLRNCRAIRHLCMNDCGGVKNIASSLELPKLEVLLVARSGFSDEALLTIGNSCSGLLKLNMEGCVGVTTEGVKNVVSHCKKLKEIKLKGCRNVNVSITDWMVYTRPSLKKIIPTTSEATTENQRKLLLHHGCQICDN